MIQRLLTILTFSLLFSCEEPPPIIEVIDYDKYGLDPKNGITVKQQKKHSALLYKLIELKTE